MDLMPNPSASQSQNNLPSQPTEKDLLPMHQARRSDSDVSLSWPQSETVRELMDNNPTVPTSRSWTPSSGFISDADEVQDRSVFVSKYNRLANKNGVRPLFDGEFPAHLQSCNGSYSSQKQSWLSRIFRGSSSQSTPNGAASAPRSTHKRSAQDVGAFMRSKPDAPKMLEVQDLVRLTGKSLLFLPQEYSPCGLSLPTCIRATAHYLAQNPTNRGLFRIPGSIRTVNSLYDYYCDARSNDADVSGTVYLATLPTHIPYRVHDVASAFKRILSGLPRGILGSLSLFDAFLAIYSQLQDRPEVSEAKQAKTRARLIALAIGTIESQFQRELICAVFGLLNLIGRVAELSPPKDSEGRPLSPSELMGYSALGVVFGPLLVGVDGLESYAIKKSSPTSGLLLVPIPQKKQRRDWHKAKDSKNVKSDFSEADKVKITGSVAEMLIVNWREVVRHMVALGTHLDQDMMPIKSMYGYGRSSISDSLVVNRPVESDVFDDEDVGDLPDQSHDSSPECSSKTVKRTRSRGLRQESVRGLSTQPSLPQLSPTMEEGYQEKSPTNPNEHSGGVFGVRQNGSMPLLHSSSYQEVSRIPADNVAAGLAQSSTMRTIPPRVSSRHTFRCGGYMNVPASDAGSEARHIMQTPPSGSTHKKTQGANRQGDRETQTHRIVRSPLSDRLHGRRRAFRRLLTRSAEKLRGTQSSYHLHQHGYRKESTTKCLQPRSAETSICPQGVSADPTLLTIAHLTADGLSGSSVLIQEPPKSVKSAYSNDFKPKGGENEARIPDFISIGSDASHEASTSKYSYEGKTPTKRKSVKALAAMFEDQSDSPPWRIHSSSQKACHVAATLHSHPEAAEDEAAKSSCVNKGDGLAHLGTRERGTQTDGIGDGAIPSLTSDIARYDCQDGMYMTAEEALSYDRSNTGTEDTHDRLQALRLLLGTKSSEAAQLKLRVQMLEESDPTSLREELDAATQEIEKWKEKAEAAERKALRFQRFTTRIRSIRSSLAMAEGSRQSGDDEVVSVEGRDAEGCFRACRVRFKRSLGSESVGEGIAEGMRDGVHDDDYNNSDKSEEEQPLSSNGTDRDVRGLDGVASPVGERGGMDFSSAAVAMWIAAQEFLSMEDDEGSHDSVGVSTSGSSLEYWKMDEEF
ncbi:hypothetical protein V8C42DRAFT_360513 [Trichoderma barbatum]